MTRDEYIVAVDTVLQPRTRDAAAVLGHALKLLPAKTRSVELMIFVDDDGEGFLNVQVYLEGPDLFILNKAIAEYCSLFSVTMQESGFEPPLPLMCSSTDFSVCDVLTDCAAKWLRSVWQHTEKGDLSLPVFVYAHLDYGSIPPMKLN